MFNVIQYAQGPMRFWIALLLVWTLIWKGIALWKAARKGHKIWYIVLVVLNTLGILDILYIYVFSNKEATKAPSTPVVPQQ